MKSKSILVFLQESYYLDNVNTVLKNIEYDECFFISKKKINRIDKSNQIHVNNLFNLIKFVLQRKSFDCLMAANVDDLYFQIIFKFISFKSFITFDEGQRSVIKGDRYFRMTFPETKNRRNKLLNFLFGFPFPNGEYFKKSSTHYTFYDPLKIEHNLQNHSNLILLNKNDNSKNIKKIFIGISSNWRYMKKQKLSVNSHVFESKLKKAAKVVNNIRPDIYLMHPREDEDFISLLDEKILILRELRGKSHQFINSLSKHNDVRVYNDRSGVLYDLGDEIHIELIDIFDRFESNEYEKYFQSLKNFRIKMGVKSEHTQIKDSSYYL